MLLDSVINPVYAGRWPIVFFASIFLYRIWRLDEPGVLKITMLRDQEFALVNVQRPVEQPPGIRLLLGL